MTKTKEEIEKIVNDLDFILLKEYFGKWSQRWVIIQDKSGYKYDYRLNDLINGHTPNFVDKGNCFSLENISLWLSINRPEFELCADNIYDGNNKKLKFYHKNCEECFYIRWYDLQSGTGCGVCSGFQVGKYNNLAYLRPELISEWSPRNEIQPDDVTEFSNKKAWWICSICEYEWVTNAISQRTMSNSGCPRCAKERVESEIATELKEYFIQNYYSETEYPICRNPETGYFLPFDIYLLGGEIPEINGVYIEIQGGQHSRISGFNYQQARKNGTTPEEEFKSQKNRDKAKKKFAKKHGTYIEIDLHKIKTTEEAIRYIEETLDT